MKQPEAIMEEFKLNGRTEEVLIHDGKGYVQGVDFSGDNLY